VPEKEPEAPVRCDLCGRVCEEVDGGRDELRVELTRNDGLKDPLYWVGDFCTQEHAAEWLGRPLPDALTPSAPQPTTWSDRAAMSGCFLVFVLGVALLVLGLWTAVQVVLDRL
jgi:hypothetical protein